MAGGKQTPRQAMIGLMYLVLLAMLAMNASKDLLNAFVMLEKGIDKTVVSFNQTNSSYYSTIAKAAASSPSYAGVNKEANEVKVLADEVVDLIAIQKIQLISIGELLTIEDTVGRMNDYLDAHGIPLQKDNQDFGAQYYMIDAEGANGIALAAAIDKFKDKVVSVLNNDGDESNDFLVARYEKLLNTADAPDPHDHALISTFVTNSSRYFFPTCLFFNSNCKNK